MGGGDTVNGDAGDDTITAYGTGTLNGGTGSDTLDYSGFVTTTGITVNLIAQTSSAGDTISGIENVIGTADTDTFISDANDNTFNGGADIDTVEPKMIHLLVMPIIIFSLLETVMTLSLAVLVMIR
jgi:hypothetical protein